MAGSAEDSAGVRVDERLRQATELLKHLGALRRRSVIALIAPDFPIIPELVQAFNQTDSAKDAQRWAARFAHRIIRW